MIFPKAKKIALELDWHKTKNSVFGLYKGYFFTVGDRSLFSNPQFKYITATTQVLSEPQKSQIKIALDSNKKLLKFSHFEIGNQSVFVQFLENLTLTKLSTVYSLFDFLAALFKNLGIAEQNHCHNCGSTDKVQPFDLNDTGVLFCTPCFNETEKKFYEIERERISEEKNYLTGFLGSVAFSIPGIVAWVIIAVYLNLLASAMSIVIAILGLKGYHYFKGKQGDLTKYLIVLSNVASILLANFATIIALLMNEGLTLNQAFSEFQTNAAALDAFYDNSMISFILAFFTWIWLLVSLKDKKLSIVPANKFQNGPAV